MKIYLKFTFTDYRNTNFEKILHKFRLFDFGMINLWQQGVSEGIPHSPFSGIPTSKFCSRMAHHCKNRIELQKIDLKNRFFMSDLIKNQRPLFLVLWRKEPGNADVSKFRSRFFVNRHTLFCFIFILLFSSSLLSGLQTPFGSAY